MTTICSALEAILFAAGEPVEVNRISLILNISEQDVLQAADELTASFSEAGHSICLVRMEGKLQLCSSPAYASVVGKILEQRKPPMLSPASLEVLAIVAYYQPVTAAYISRVRGVDSSYTISSLADKGLIESRGKLEAPGRPTLYGTTDLFLRTMQISDLSELPGPPEIASAEGIQQLQQAIEALQAKEAGSLSDQQRSLLCQLDRYHEFCRDLGVTPENAGLAWLLSNPAVTCPIVVASEAGQLTSSLKALECKLTPEALDQLDAIFPKVGEAPEAYAW